MITAQPDPVRRTLTALRQQTDQFCGPRFRNYEEAGGNASARLAQLESFEAQCMKASRDKHLGRLVAPALAVVTAAREECALLVEAYARGTTPLADARAELERVEHEHASVMTEFSAGTPDADRAVQLRDAMVASESALKFHRDVVRRLTIEAQDRLKSASRYGLFFDFAKAESTAAGIADSYTTDRARDGGYSHACGLCDGLTPAQIGLVAVAALVEIERFKPRARAIAKTAELRGLGPHLTVDGMRELFVGALPAGGAP